MYLPQGERYYDSNQVVGDTVVEEGMLGFLHGTQCSKPSLSVFQHNRVSPMNSVTAYCKKASRNEIDQLGCMILHPSPPLEKIKKGWPGSLLT